MRKATSSKLSRRQRTDLATLAAMRDEQIDTKDIPEVRDWRGARRGVFFRPVKQQLTLRLDADLVEWFRAKAPGGRGYQTSINMALRDYVDRQQRSPR